MVKRKVGRSRRHTPIRTCIVCRESADKRRLTRLVRTEDGVTIDDTGKLNGRGAYLCSKPACWETAINHFVLDKALRTTLTPEDRERLRTAMPEP